MPHIEVRDVSLTYDTPAGRVAGVATASFDIEQSEFLCIVGPSGCGKSTLLNLIAGFLPPMRISPPVGVRKPARRLSNVDLPQPDGPTMHRN